MQAPGPEPNVSFYTRINIQQAAQESTLLNFIQSYNKLIHVESVTLIWNSHRFLCKQTNHSHTKIYRRGFCCQTKV